MTEENTTEAKADTKAEEGAEPQGNPNAKLWEKYGISEDGMSRASGESERQPAPDTKPDPEASASPEPKEDQKEGSAGDGGEDPEVQKARESIERKFPAAAKAMLSSMDDTAILAMGTQLRADLKAYGDQKNEIDRLTSGQANEPRHDSEETEQGEKDARPSEDPKGVDISDAVGSLDPVLYEGLPEALKGVAHAIYEQGAKDTKAAIEAVESRGEKLQIEVVDAQVRRELGDRFPVIQDPEFLGKVQSTMRVIEPGMEYKPSDDVFARREQLMTYAIALNDPNALQESRSKTTRPKAGPRPPTSRDTGSAPMTRHERYATFVAARAEGDSPELARKKAGLTI